MPSSDATAAGLRPRAASEPVIPVGAQRDAQLRCDGSWASSSSRFPESSCNRRASGTVRDTGGRGKRKSCRRVLDDESAGDEDGIARLQVLRRGLDDAFPVKVKQSVNRSESHGTAASKPHLRELRCSPPIDRSRVSLGNSFPVEREHSQRLSQLYESLPEFVGHFSQSRPI